MRNGQTSAPAEVHATSPPTTAARRSVGPDPLSEAQQTFGNREFGRLVGTPPPPPGSENVADVGKTAATPAASFVVEDDAETIGLGQMRRTAFLAAVRAAVCATANEGFAGTGRTADDCPWIEHWLSVYEQRDAEHLNGALRKFAPETTRATTATEAVAMIAARVRRSVDMYAATGEISGIPGGVSPDVPGLGVLGGVLGGLLFKARPGGAATSRGDPYSVRAQLGAGQPMPGGVRSRMEGVFGVSLSHVRLHRDGEAASLSSRLNARAFTVGEHVAFGAGEYRPGTVVGDALLAHELAHTLQQGAGNAAAVSTESVEADADRSAVGAVTSLWKPGGDTRAGVLPRMRSGLRLSRCTPSPPTKTPDKALPGAKGPASVEEAPPDPDKSFWFQDPKKQPKEGATQEMDFSKGQGKGETPQITSTAQLRQQVVVDPPSKLSRVGNIHVRFGIPGSSIGPGGESGEIRSAKSAVLQALAEAVTDVANLGTAAVSWENAAEKKKVLAERERQEQQRARLSEVFTGFSADKPLNVYLAPPTEQETRTGQYYPTTAQVWISLGDVGDASKLQTAMRLPLQHILGGPNPAKGGSDQPADLKRTLLHEGLHAMLVNRGIDSGSVWRDVEPKLKLSGPADVQENAKKLIRAAILAQEELFAYNNEESLYAAVSGSQQSGKVLYELFMGGAERFFKKKAATSMTQLKKRIDVAEKAGGKKVAWEIVYTYPAAMTLEAADDEVIKLIMMTWPLR